MKMNFNFELFEDIGTLETLNVPDHHNSNSLNNPKCKSRITNLDTVDDNKNAITNQSHNRNIFNSIMRNYHTKCFVYFNEQNIKMYCYMVIVNEAIKEDPSKIPIIEKRVNSEPKLNGYLKIAENNSNHYWSYSETIFY